MTRIPTDFRAGLEIAQKRVANLLILSAKPLEI